MNETRSAILTIIISGGLLLGFALIGVGLVALTYEGTLDRIDENRQQTMLRQLQTVIPPEIYDNEPHRDTLMVRDPALLGSQDMLTVYRARKDGEPAAAVLTAVAPDGYSGRIVLLVGILADSGKVSGVRVISHQETPGLGDAIERERSDWISIFDDRSLGDPPREDWRLRRDSGEFDHITSASITSRAVVAAVRNALIYFSRHRDMLFASPEQPQPPTSEDESDAARTGTDTNGG